MTIVGWALIAIAGLALFGFAVFEIGQRQHKQQASEKSDFSGARNINESNEVRRSDRARHEESESDGFLSSAEKHSGLFLVVVTALLAVMTGFLWSATKKLVQSSERIGQQQIAEMKKSNEAATKAANAAQQSVQTAIETSRRDQRAWVGLISVDQVANPEVGKPYQIRMLIRNSGKSFAKDVRVAARVRVVPKGGLPDYSNEKTTEWESRGLLPPDTLFTPVASVAFLPDQPLALTQEQLRDINAGAVTIFVSGKIWYDDVFDRAHWTTFCFFLIPGSNGVFQAYREHNEADSDR